MTETAPPSAPPCPSELSGFVQPKRWIRWIAVLLAAAGWYVSLYSFRISAGEIPTDPVMRALCGEPTGQDGTSGCHEVLTSEYAYLPRQAPAGSPRLPVATLGMAYFGALGLWYLFVGPPTRRARGWHLLAALVVLCGALYSAHAISIMATVLHRWCPSCLTAHAINAGLVLLTLWGYPWRRASRPAPAHPSARLALATATAGLLLCACHLAVVYMILANTIAKRMSSEYLKITGDPAYVVFNYQRQPTVEIPLRDDEVLGGQPEAPNTAVVFGDFQCPACRQLHDALTAAVDRHPGKLRVAFRHYPQDPECNPKPNFAAGGHGSACRAARAAEAAHLVGGREKYLAMRKLLWERQDELPRERHAQQSEEQRGLVVKWAAELGLDPVAFTAAMDAPAVAARIEADLALAERLGLQAMPVVYLNGRRLVGWSRPETWDALLGGAATAPAFP